MLDNYIFFVFFQIFIFISIIGYGYFFQNKVLGINFFNFSTYLIFGIIIISFIATFYHLFFSVSKIFNLFIYFLGMVLFLLFFEKCNKILTNKYIYIVFIISLIVGFGYKPNDDYLTYHLPYIINFTTEKAIFGLANIQENQGWNSMWLNFSATFFLPVLNFKSINLANIILFKVILIFFYEIFFEKKNYNNLILYLSIVFIIYFLFKSSRLGSYGTDTPSNYLILICIFFLFQINDNNNKKLNEDLFCAALIIASFSILIKISNLFIIFVLFLIYFKNKFSFFSKPNLFVFLFFLIFFIQQIIYSGCFLFPLHVTCLENFEWTAIEYAKSFSNGTNHDNKSYSSYTGIMSPQEYVQNYNWVLTWVKRNGIEMIEHFIIILFIFLFIFFSNKKKYAKIKVKANINTFVFYSVLFFLFISSIFWFHKQPVIRYGILNLLILLTLSMYIIFFKNFNFKKIGYSFKKIFLFALFFLLAKNLFAIKKNNYLPFYDIKSFKYEKKQDLENTSIFVSQENWCGNIPFLCITKNKNLEIKKNNFGYLVVTKIIK